MHQSSMRIFGRVLNLKAICKLVDQSRVHIRNGILSSRWGRQGRLNRGPVNEWGVAWLAGWEAGASMTSSLTANFSSGTAEGNGIVQTSVLPRLEMEDAYKVKLEKQGGRNKARMPAPKAWMQKAIREKRKMSAKRRKKKQIRESSSIDQRIKFRIQRAKRKEVFLIEALKKYEIRKTEHAMSSEQLTANERFYLKRMGQKLKNYVPVGRRGIYGGVILNMHLHWKKHETVKVICKHCSPDKIREYADEITRLSGGVPIHIEHDTIIFYRGKNYVQPKVMTPKNTLTKRKALLKSKLLQSLDSVRRFIAISEKELEIYYQHTAFYGKPSDEKRDDKIPEDQMTCATEIEKVAAGDAVGTKICKNALNYDSLSHCNRRK